MSKSSSAGTTFNGCFWRSTVSTGSCVFEQVSVGRRSLPPSLSVKVRIAGLSLPFLTMASKRLAIDSSSISSMPGRLRSPQSECSSMERMRVTI